VQATLHHRTILFSFLIQPVLFNLSYSIVLVTCLKHPSYSPVLFILSNLSYLIHPVSLILSHSSCLIHPVLFILYYSNCLTRPVLFNLSYSTCLIQRVLTQFFTWFFSNDSKTDSRRCRSAASLTLSSPVESTSTSAASTSTSGADSMLLLQNKPVAGAYAIKLFIDLIVPLF